MNECLDYAILHVSRYPKTIFLLKKQLQKKGYESEIIQETISKLEERGYLDDRNYTSLYLISEGIKKGKPLFVLRQKLIQKGIEKEIIECVIKEKEEELTQGRKNKLIKEIEKMKTKGIEVRKIIQRLQGRGYEYGEIKETIEN